MSIFENAKIQTFRELIKKNSVGHLRSHPTAQKNALGTGHQLHRKLSAYFYVKTMPKNVSQDTVKTPKKPCANSLISIYHLLTKFYPSSYQSFTIDYFLEL